MSSEPFVGREAIRLPSQRECEMRQLYNLNSESGISVSQTLHELPARDNSPVGKAVCDSLRRAIICAELPSGTRLNQETIANKLGVSRMPIRAALADLASEGLVVFHPTGGAFVRELTKADVANIYEVRIGLEIHAIRELASLPVSTRLEALDKIIAKCKPLAAQMTALELLENDREFHAIIMDATGNSYYGRAMVPLRSTIDRAMYGLLQLDQVAVDAWNEHEAIVDALKRKDGGVAMDLMSSHLRNGALKLQKLLKDHG